MRFSEITADGKRSISITFLILIVLQDAKNVSIQSFFLPGAERFAPEFYFRFLRGHKYTLSGQDI